MPINVLHVIETLNRGGGEVLLVNYINSLPAKFNNIVVYMHEPEIMKSELKNVSGIYCLNYKGKMDLLPAALCLSRIIKEHNVALVHSHLYWPTIIARLAFKNKAPLIFSVHSLMSDDAFGPNILSKYLEKLTYSGRQTAVFVSKAALLDYKSHINTTGETVLLYNFVKDEFYEERAKKEFSNADGLKLVSVGNMRPQKNHMFLIKAVQKMKDYNVSLDIYGSGYYMKQLEEYIEQNKIRNVRLMGSHAHPEEVLKEYDAFVFASKYEGFCIAMVEAMAVGLPCIVPDLEVLKEVSEGEQLYYEPDNTEQFIQRLLMLYNNVEELKRYSVAARACAMRYRKEEHIRQLVALYERKLQLHG